jgi:hypothetical protein
MNMKNISRALMPTMLSAVGMLMLSACWGSGPYYGGPVGPPPGTVVYGAYDEGHVWHDRYWWVANRHDWVHQNHPDWIEHETPEEHQAFEHHH